MQTLALPLGHGAVATLTIISNKILNVNSVWEKFIKQRVFEAVKKRCDVSAKKEMPWFLIAVLFLNETREDGENRIRGEKYDFNTKRNFLFKGPEKPGAALRRQIQPLRSKRV
ncbi:MAG: hypothetical protein ACOX0U_02835 [Oscillospiraceae bacterium]